MLTREELLKQRAAYEAAKNQALNVANLNQGAIEAIDWVLAQMTAPVPSETEGPPCTHE